jgi:hypothetical protein
MTPPVSRVHIPINAYAQTQVYCISVLPSCFGFPVFSLEPGPRSSNQGAIDCCHEQPLFICITICAIHVPLPTAFSTKTWANLSLLPFIPACASTLKVSIPELIFSFHSSTWAAGSPTSTTLPRGTRSWTYRTNSTPKQSLWHRAHPNPQRGRSRRAP